LEAERDRRVLGHLDLHFATLGSPGGAVSCQGERDLASVGFLEAEGRRVGAPSCVRAPSLGGFLAPNPLGLQVLEVG